MTRSHEISTYNQINSNVQTSQSELPDKVYTFLAPSDIILFEDLNLEKNYVYYIFIELVTPHNCSKMRIRLWDPDGKRYDIFESEMFHDPEFGSYFEIPFGTAYSGEYDIEFYMENDYNLNLYIRIEQGPKCLYDKMGSQEVNNLLLYRTTRFYDGRHIEHNVQLKTDISYKFYIGRVSAISIKDDNTVKVNYTIEDAEGIEFVIYSEEILADIDGINIFHFGTANGGLYTIKISILCSVSYANIGYSVIEDYQISDIVEGNNTDESDDMGLFDGLWSNNTALPVVWVIGTLIFIGVVIGALVIVYIHNKNKNTVSLDLDKR